MITYNQIISRLEEYKLSPVVFKEQGLHTEEITSVCYYAPPLCKYDWLEATRILFDGGHGLLIAYQPNGSYIEIKILNKTKTPLKNATASIHF